MRHPRTPIARIEAPSSAIVQALLNEAVASWRSEGIHIAGLVEETHGLPDRVCNAGVLRDIVTSDTYSIYLETLPAGKVCHIDASGAERACKAVLDQLPGCDLLVLSKFGKLEEAGEGLFPAFAAAAEAGTPLLTTVSAKHLSAWNDFAPDAATLPADLTALRAWFSAQLGGGSAMQARSPARA